MAPPVVLWLEAHAEKVSRHAHASEEAEEGGKDGEAVGPGQEGGVWVGEPVTVLVNVDAKEDGGNDQEEGCVSENKRCEA